MLNAHYTDPKWLGNLLTMVSIWPLNNDLFYIIIFAILAYWPLRPISYCHELVVLAVVVGVGVGRPLQIFLFSAVLGSSNGYFWFTSYFLSETNDPGWSQNFLLPLDPSTGMGPTARASFCPHRSHCVKRLFSPVLGSSNGYFLL